MNTPKIDRVRPEGVYCSWKTEPPEGGTFSVRLLTIERVNGDDTVDVLGCTADEALVILRSILEETAGRSASSDLPEVAGMMECSMNEFVRRCRVALSREQARPLCDTVTVAALCDAVRLAREYMYFQDRLTVIAEGPPK